MSSVRTTLVHDGTSYRSIAQGYVKDYIFNNLLMSASNRFFVHHNPLLTEVWFCYVSGDNEVAYQNTPYPNKALVYNYSNNTWAPRDLPNVSSITLASLPQSMTWAADARTWAASTSTWYSLQGQAPKITFGTSVSNSGASISANRLLGFDNPYAGFLTGTALAEVNPLSWAQRSSLDLDELGKNLRDYMVIKTIYPQAKEFGNPSTLNFQFGATMVPEATPTLSTAVTYDPSTDYKIDTMFGGRYLSWKVYESVPYPFELTGFDFDYYILGKR